MGRGRYFLPRMSFRDRGRIQYLGYRTSGRVLEYGINSEIQSLLRLEYSNLNTLVSDDTYQLFKCHGRSCPGVVTLCIPLETRTTLIDYIYIFVYLRNQQLYSTITRHCLESGQPSWARPMLSLHPRNPHLHSALMATGTAIAAPLGPCVRGLVGSGYKRRGVHDIMISVPAPVHASPPSPLWQTS